MGRLEGKTAVVTGGADGIGHAIADAMTREGAHVFVGDIDDKKGSAFVAELTKAGRKADYLHCDVSEEEDIAGLIAAAVDNTGRLDILVNNAAIAIGGMPVHEMTDEQWHRLIAVNLTSVFRGCKYALPHMIRQKSGSIINMASAQGHIGLDGWTAYAGAKGAVMSMTRQMAVEFGPHNVRVNSISPGTINTPMNEQGRRRSRRESRPRLGEDASHRPHRQTRGSRRGGGLSRQRCRRLHHRHRPPRRRRPHRRAALRPRSRLVN